MLVNCKRGQSHFVVDLVVIDLPLSPFKTQCETQYSDCSYEQVGNSSIVNLANLLTAFDSGSVGFFCIDVRFCHLSQSG